MRLRAKAWPDFWLGGRRKYVMCSYIPKEPAKVDWPITAANCLGFGSKRCLGCKTFEQFSEEYGDNGCDPMHCLTCANRTPCPCWKKLPSHKGFCLNCNKPFKKTSNSQLYCDLSCRNAYYKKQRKRREQYLRTGR